MRCKEQKEGLGVLLSLTPVLPSAEWKHPLLDPNPLALKWYSAGPSRSMRTVLLALTHHQEPAQQSQPRHCNIFQLLSLVSRKLPACLVFVSSSCFLWPSWKLLPSRKNQLSPPLCRGNNGGGLHRETLLLRLSIRANAALAGLYYGFPWD